MAPQQTHAKVSQPGRDAASRTAADEDIDQAVAAAADRATADALVEHSDELLDEIDHCLEENVLEVLVSYVQKGGQ
jgi:ubiquitin-like protein Pup